jgi:SanA protein
VIGRKPSRSLLIWLARAVRSLLIGGLVLAALAVAFVVGVDQWIAHKAKNKIVSSVADAPLAPVALVLGTSKYIGKSLNPYYTFRIESAIELYQQGKVKGFLLSGDNAHRSYNEPWTMKRDLLKAGIPESVIFLDYAGFRTLDSIVRAQSIFDVDEMIIVTQTFHCYRALYIADHIKIDAHCLGVKAPIPTHWYNVRFREIFARTKAFLDINIIHTQPRFLGDKEPIIDLLNNPQTEKKVHQQD